MYVAITRARRRLYLSYSQTRLLHGQTRYGMPSRFMGELPPEDLKWLSPPASQAAHGGWGFRGRGVDDSAYGRGFGSSRGYGGRSGYGGGPPARQLPAEQYAGTGAWREGPSPTTRAPARDARFRIGQGVAHARFGEGVVTGIEGSGDDARIQVKFADHGSKWLALAVAKLEPVQA